MYLILFLLAGFVGYFIGSKRIRPNLEKTFADESKLSKLKKRKGFIKYCTAKNISSENVTMATFEPVIEEYVAKTKRNMLIQVFVMAVVMTVWMSILHSISR